MNGLQDPLPLHDHAFVVLGATGGIGSATARALAQRGARLLLAGRDDVKLRALAGELDGETFVLDPADLAEVAECVEAGRELGAGRLSGVANCVGSLLLKPAHRTSLEEWDEVLRVNLTTAFATVRAAGRSMRDGGSLTLCSSAAAQIGLANHEAIAAAKAGIEGLVRSAAATYARQGLRINAVAPGLVRTPMTRAWTESDRAREGSERMHALGRLGEPAEIASALVWLLDPAQSWITGEVLRVDGGLARVTPVPRR